MGRLADYRTHKALNEARSEGITKHGDRCTISAGGITLTITEDDWDEMNGAANMSDQMELKGGVTFDASDRKAGLVIRKGARKAVLTDEMVEEISKLMGWAIK